MDAHNSAHSLLPRYKICTHEAVMVLYFDPYIQRLTIHKNSAYEFVDLGFTHSRILELLINRSDTIVARDEIFEFAWSGRVVGQNSLNQAIARLRQLLGDDEKRQIIQTVPRYGYRLSSAFVSLTVELQGSESIESDIESPVVHIVAPVAVAEKNPARLVWLCNVRLLRMCLCGLIVLLALSLLWRVDWGLLAQSEVVTLSRQVGEQQQFFVAANVQDLTSLQEEVSSVSQRFQSLAKSPSVVIFTKMHSFYSFVCIGSHGDSDFILAHRSKLSALTDMQLEACII